jgi:hypothetical protein
MATPSAGKLEGIGGKVYHKTAEQVKKRCLISKSEPPATITQLCEKRYE